MQLLYQLDVRGDADQEAVYQATFDSEVKPDLIQPAIALARLAYETRQPADALIAQVAPDWPTYRQPPIDRAILRLGYYELISGHAPVSVVINEAVELAKEFCAEQSPAFINGVLDRIARQLQDEGKLGTPNDAPDDWLDDATGA